LVLIQAQTPPTPKTLCPIRFRPFFPPPPSMKCLISAYGRPSKKFSAPLFFLPPPPVGDCTTRGDVQPYSVTPPRFVESRSLGLRPPICFLFPTTLAEPDPLLLLFQSRTCRPIIERTRSCVLPPRERSKIFFLVSRASEAQFSRFLIPFF